MKNIKKYDIVIYSQNQHPVRIKLNKHVNNKQYVNNSHKYLVRIEYYPGYIYDIYFIKIRINSYLGYHKTSSSRVVRLVAQFSRLKSRGNFVSISRFSPICDLLFRQALFLIASLTRKCKTESLFVNQIEDRERESLGLQLQIKEFFTSRPGFFVKFLFGD